MRFGRSFFSLDEQTRAHVVNETNHVFTARRTTTILSFRRVVSNTTAENVIRGGGGLRVDSVATRHTFESVVPFAGPR